jgi:hypothetical protein
MQQKTSTSIHDQCAPYWASTFILLVATGLSTIWFKMGGFWNGYVLDMVGPAWTYILFRGLFTAQVDNQWTRFFTPLTTLMILLIMAYGIEILQYFRVYASTFDPWDFVAYSSILVPVFIIDLLLTKQKT